jgi:signal transduction histidine kinase
MNPFQTVSQYLDVIFDTDSDSLFKRNIQLAAFTYIFAMLIVSTHIVRTLSGRLPSTVIPMLLVSILILLSGLYLLVVKKRHWFSIYILVVYLIINKNINMSMSLSGLTMLNAAWDHVAAFAIVFMLGVKKSIVPVTLFSGSLILQIYLGLDNSVDDFWDTSRFIEFIQIHILSLFVAYYNEWSMAKAFRERDQAREQKNKSTETHAKHVEMLLDNKKQLLVDVSHELRTPLSILKANIEAMEDGINQHEDSYPVIHRKLNQIDRLIQDIYLISKYDVQQLTLYIDTVYLSELTDELMSSFLQLAEEKGLILIMNTSLTSDESYDMVIEGDWQRLIQLFGNLLQNSLNYTDRGGQINLSTRIARSGIEITVQDSAPGVPEQEQLRLFERLYRKESSRNRATGGSGLGLSICKAIIEAHHGTIAIASSPLGGLAITSWLPLTQPANNAAALK